MKMKHVSSVIDVPNYSSLQTATEHRTGDACLLEHHRHPKFRGQMPPACSLLWDNKHKHYIQRVVCLLIPSYGVQTCR